MINHRFGLRRIGIGLAAAVCLMWITGCGKTESVTAPAEPTYSGSEPITITISWTAPETITKTITEHPYIKNKYPNITFAYQDYSTIDEMIFAGNAPDIINLADFQMPELVKKKVPYDLSELVKQNKYDLNLFPSDVISIIKKFSPEGKLIGLPDKSPLNASSAHTPYFTIYNKDLFDKFAVPYPKDNMTWEEYIDLGKRLTRKEGGIEYTGFTSGNFFSTMVPQLNLQYAGADRKVNLSNPGWVKIGETIKRAYDAQGSTAFSDGSLFLKGTAAMLAGYNEVYIFNPARYENLVNWDMATFPRANEKLDVRLALGLYVVNSQSKHKDAALKVITAFLSDEMQADRRVKWDDPLIKKRNTNAIKGISNAQHIPNEYTSVGNNVMWTHFLEYIKKGTDVNTAIREMQEKVQQEVDKLK